LRTLWQWVKKSEAFRITRRRGLDRHAVPGQREQGVDRAVHCYVVGDEAEFWVCNIIDAALACIDKPVRNAADNVALRASSLVSSPDFPLSFFICFSCGAVFYLNQ
jgi:hypothetical protein